MLFRSGVLLFDSVADLDRLLTKSIRPETYAAMREVIEINYQRAKRYMISEDWIYNEYPQLFAE